MSDTELDTNPLTKAGVCFLLLAAGDLIYYSSAIDCVCFVVFKCWVNILSGRFSPPFHSALGDILKVFRIYWMSHPINGRWVQFWCNMLIVLECTLFSHIPKVITLLVSACFACPHFIMWHTTVLSLAGWKPIRGALCYNITITHSASAELCNPSTLIS